jgi:hypothetical protein
VASADGGQILVGKYNSHQRDQGHFVTADHMASEGLLADFFELAQAKAKPNAFLSFSREEYPTRNSAFNQSPISLVDLEIVPSCQCIWNEFLLSPWRSRSPYNNLPELDGETEYVPSSPDCAIL